MPFAQLSQAGGEMHGLFLHHSTHLRRGISAAKRDSPPSSGTESFGRTLCVTDRKAACCAVLHRRYRRYERSHSEGMSFAMMIPLPTASTIGSGACRTNATSPRADCADPNDDGAWPTSSERAVAAASALGLGGLCEHFRARRRQVAVR